MKRTIIWIVLTLVVIVLVLFGNLMLFEKQSSIVTQGLPIKKYAVEKSALLVIDMQEYTTGQLSSDTCYTNPSGNLIRLTNQIIDSARERNIPVVYVRSEVSDKLINLINNSLAPGSEGVVLDKRLHIVSDFIVTKQVEDAFRNPRLDSILVGNQVSTLYITGLDAAHCVKSTIEAAQNRGYKIYAIGDAILSKSDSLKVKMLSDFKSRGVEIVKPEKFFD